MALDRNSSQNSKWKYHVFLSFRGEDTRLGFTDHLYEALVQKGILTFRDDEELARGEVISPKLLEAIEQSLSSIVVISKNYASSTWCLEELQKILESKTKLGQEVFPIFYGVDPSDVRHQRGSFLEAFKKHEEKFVENKEKLQKWRIALKEVANLSGWDSKNQHETKLIEEIVAQVWTKLEPKLPVYTDGLVAIEKKANNMYSLLRLGLEGVHFVGIWGMGGIGKTTLVNVVFKRIKSQFDVSWFRPNVREASKEGDQGLLRLQNELLSHMKIKSMVIGTLDQGKDKIRNLFYNKKVLLVLDDVSAKSQLENLAGKQEWFGPGSRVIVTTRDKHLLTSHGVSSEMYEIEILNSDESFQLFCGKAFKGDELKEDYLELSKNVVEYTGGLPLALDVLGSFLCGRSVQEWEDALIKLSKVPYDDILNKLKISYDMLEEEHKTTFLDIACFFKGWQKDRVTKILDDCDLHPTIGINVLVERSLVTCIENFVGMHDLLEEMGKYIVLQESPNDLGGCSRLWSMEDVNQVFTKNMATDKVQGIVLKLSAKSSEACWHPEAFSKMSNLRTLIIPCDARLPLGLKSLPSSLKVLIWSGCTLKALPPGLQLDELVHLQINQSKINRLWNGTKFLGKLKVIDLSYCEDLVQTLDISGMPNLKELYLDGCKKIVEVHPSVGQHKKLEILSLMHCHNFTILPSKMGMSSLKELNLLNCTNIKRLPDFGESMKCLLLLNLENCENLTFLPNTISNLKFLKRLNMSGCSKICSLPDNIIENKALEHLDLSRTSIREVNVSLFCLENLKTLSFSGCRGPAFSSFGWKRPSNPPTYLKLPRFVSSLSSLTVLDLSCCNLSLELIPEDLGRLSSLERLNLSWNKDLELPVDSIANLSKLHCLEIEGCKLESLLKLSSHARFYPMDFHIEAGSLDLCKLWKLFDSNDSDQFEPPDIEYLDSYEGQWMGTLEVQYISFPARYDLNFYHAGRWFQLDSDSSASLMVDIPDDCKRGEWWGIAAFVAFEPPLNGLMTFMNMNWWIECSDPYAGPSLCQCSEVASVSGNQYMLTLIMRESYIYLQRHRRGYRAGDGRGFKRHWKYEYDEDSTLQFQVKLPEAKITEFRWHVVCKEDFNFGDMRNWRDEVASTSKAELKEEDVTASNEQNGENSNKLFSLRKPFHDRRGGWYLSAVALISIMAGTTVFLSSRQRLDSELQTRAHDAAARWREDQRFRNRTKNQIGKMSRSRFNLFNVLNRWQSQKSNNITRNKQTRDVSDSRSDRSNQPFWSSWFQNIDEDKRHAQ